MKLPADAAIVASKLRDYLLVQKLRNDKSAWLATAGYGPDNWPELERELRSQLLAGEAEIIEDNGYGLVYRMDVLLTGPNGQQLDTTTIWMTEHATDVTKFITLYPRKGR